ncbi:YdcH family protein [Ferrimonas senticii]|uniref:YdcH family protein n=1 Tax=Ferrimonas senticii TaxID=394566 RepID=UPI0003F6A99F|nr:YdcH family protein [Ferrimonas senticii]
MPIRNHALTKEFPQYIDRIKELRMSDLPFREACDKYHELDKEIRNLEQNDMPIEDSAFTQLRFERVFLKDQLYEQLKQGG